jgi:CheY-like chemotaxis protein
MTGGNSNILCLNDDEAALMTRKVLLEAHGYHVVATTHPQDAIDIIRSQLIDLVVADHFLWYTEGGKITAQMKRLQPTLLIVLFSGVVESPEDIQGVDGVVNQIEGPNGLLNILSHFVSARKAA